MLFPPGHQIRVVVIGWPDLPRSWKNDLAYAAEQLGWQVTHVQPSRVTASQVIRACDGAHLLLWARTHGRDPRGDLNRMLRAVEATGTTTVGVHLDLYWGIPRRQREIGQHPWWTCQKVWTADGGPRPWAGRGVNHRWLSPPCPDRYAYRADPTPDYTADVVFVGGISSAHPGRRQLIDWAADRYRDRFAWWGKAGRGSVWAADLNRLHASAKVVIGDSAPTPDGHYWSDRVPGTCGRGGVLVHPDVAGLAAEYGDAVATYPRGDFRALGDVVDDLLADPARRNRIRSAGHAIVTAEHLWRHRLQRIADEAGL